MSCTEDTDPVFTSMDKAPSSSSDWAFSVGIDVGKASLELALRDGEKTVAKTTVSNDSDGHETLLDWLQSRGAGPEKTCVCMEASGDFEKGIAQRLYEEDYRVSVVNPRRIKGYASSQLQRTKTDSADAALIARFGQREDPRPWEPPHHLPHPIGSAHGFSLSSGPAGLA